MKKLSEVEKETLLIRVLSQGSGSVEYARDLLTGANDPESEPPEPENDAEPWCICGVCRRMQDEQENVCCQKRTCVTSYVMFNTTCLDREVLQLAIWARCDIRADEPDYSTQKLPEGRITAVHVVEIWKTWKGESKNSAVLCSYNHKPSLSSSRWQLHGL